MLRSLLATAMLALPVLRLNLIFFVEITQVGGQWRLAASAHCISVVRTILLPRLVIHPTRRLSLDWLAPGVMPMKAARCPPFAKFPILTMVISNTAAPISPMLLMGIRFFPEGAVGVLDAAIIF